MNQDWKKSPKWSFLECGVKVCYLQSTCFTVLFFILLRDRLKSTLKLENSLIHMRNYFKIIILQTVFSPNQKTKFKRNSLIVCLSFCLSVEWVALKRKLELYYQKFLKIFIFWLWEKNMFFYLLFRGSFTTFKFWRRTWLYFTFVCISL